MGISCLYADLSYCTKTNTAISEDVQIRREYNGSLVTQIADYVILKNCKNMKTVTTIPIACRPLHEAFYNCTVMTQANIGAGVTEIKNSAFYGCTALTSIAIPANVTSIGNSASRWL